MVIEVTPVTERPRERCLQKGPASLSLRECIALILGSGPPGIGCLGIAENILNKPGKGLPSSEEERAFFSALEVSGTGHLTEISGLGPAGKSKILAAFELGRRYALYRSDLPSPTGPRPSPQDLTIQALAKISNLMRAAPQEWFGFVPVHRNGKLGELCIVEKGARTHINLDPAELFARILALRPRGVFLFHNHPSGVLTPSVEDLDLTENIREISEKFGILLLGHWIVTSTQEHWLN
ncbi:MAG: JAB domain-containing protein [Bdellovibrionia bacterium]